MALSSVKQGLNSALRQRTGEHEQGRKGERNEMGMDIDKRVCDYVLKYRRARSDRNSRKYKAMIDNQIGYEMLSTGKSAEQIKKEWGLSDDYK